MVTACTPGQDSTSEGERGEDINACANPIELLMRFQLDALQPSPLVEIQGQGQARIRVLVHAVSEEGLLSGVLGPPLYALEEGQLPESALDAEGVERWSGTQIVTAAIGEAKTSTIDAGPYSFYSPKAMNITIEQCP